VGTVYRAIDRLLARQVAIKIIAINDANRDRVADIAHEVRATAAIQSPSVLTVHEVMLTDDDQLAVIMELAHGVSLRRVLSRNGRRPSLLHTLEAIRQTTEGLGAAHVAGIIHRDVKPENVMIHVPSIAQRQQTALGHGLHRVRTIEVKVVDFGIAFIVGADAAKDDLFYGTPAFASPEQITRPNTIDSRADIYSTGALLFYAITGRTPFRGSTAADVLRMHIHADRPLVTQDDLEAPVPIAHHLNKVITTAMAKKPDKRYQDMTMFARAIDELGDRVFELRAQ